MQFMTPTCPECEEPPQGTVEHLSGRCTMENAGTDAEPNWRYDDTGTVIWWDSAMTQYEDETTKERINLVCHNGHDWYSRFTGQL